MVYADKVTRLVFTAYVGHCPSPATPFVDVVATAEFFTKNFATVDYNPYREDLVVQFCQMVPAGAFGSSEHSNAARAHYPDYTDQIDQAINAAWEFAGMEVVI